MKKLSNQDALHYKARIEGAKVALATGVSQYLSGIILVTK